MTCAGPSGHPSTQRNLGELFGITVSALLIVSAGLAVVLFAANACSPRAAVTLHATSLTLTGPSRENPAQSLDLDSELRAHATALTLGAGPPFWTALPDQPSAPKVSLKPPADAACRKLSITVSRQQVADATGELVLRIEPLNPLNRAECDAASWKLLLPGQPQPERAFSEALVLTLKAPPEAMLKVLSNVRATRLLTQVLQSPEVLGAKAPPIAPHSDVSAENIAVKVIHLRLPSNARTPVLQAQLRTESIDDLSAAPGQEIGSPWLERFGALGGLFLVMVVLSIINLVFDIFRYRRPVPCESQTTARP